MYLKLILISTNKIANTNRAKISTLLFECNFKFNANHFCTSIVINDVIVSISGFHIANFSICRTRSYSYVNTEYLYVVIHKRRPQEREWVQDEEEAARADMEGVGLRKSGRPLVQILAFIKILMNFLPRL